MKILLRFPKPHKSFIIQFIISFASLFRVRRDGRAPAALRVVEARGGPVALRRNLRRRGLRQPGSLAGRVHGSFCREEPQAGGEGRESLRERTSSCTSCMNSFRSASTCLRTVTASWGLPVNVLRIIWVDLRKGIWIIDLSGRLWPDDIADHRRHVREITRCIQEIRLWGKEGADHQPRLSGTVSCVSCRICSDCWSLWRSACASSLSTSA